MEQNQDSKPKGTAKDFFLNLGAIVALYTVVANLISLLFTVINNAYPQIRSYYYVATDSVSFPVATLIIFFPIFILLMWLLEKGYAVEPQKRHVGVRKWLTYITLFVAGLTLAGDLVTVVYYFIDGQELTTGFLLKALTVLIIALGIFMYYIADIRDRMSVSSRKIWLGASAVLIIASIAWGFVVLGSPREQRLVKYDAQKVNDLQNINSQVVSYWQLKGTLPANLQEMSDMQYSVVMIDQQSNKPYEYEKTGNMTYNLCADFNKASKDNESSRALYYPYNTSWAHPAGRYCFPQTINTNMYPGPKVLPM